MSPRSISRRRAVLRVLTSGVLTVGVLTIGVLSNGAVAHAAPSAAELEKQIRAKSSALSKVVEQYNRVNEEQKQTKLQITKLAESLSPLEQQATAARGNVARIASTAYQNGGLTGLNALLAGGESRTVLDKLGMLVQLAENQQDVIASAQVAADRHQAAKRALDGKLADAAERAVALAKQKKSIERELDKLYELRRQAYGSATTTGSAYTGTIPSVSGKAGSVVTFAYNAIGKPYVWAADGPEGYDCSGLTLAAWRTAGVNLPHNAAMQWNVVAHITRAQLAPGDLVFYADLGHMGIYVGSGKVIHAPTFGDSVKISSIDMMPPYGYGRVKT